MSLISSRGERLTLPGLPYLAGVLEGFRDPFDIATNPDGVVLLAVAENKLCWDLLKPKIEACFADLPQWTASYGPMQGQPMLTTPLAAFLAKYLFDGVRPDPEQAHTRACKYTAHIMHSSTPYACSSWWEVG